MNEINKTALVIKMRELAIRAGQEIIKIYETDEFDIETKEDASPVTRADKAADAIITEGLAHAFPNITLVTEEQASTHAQNSNTFLIVDPLDGTKEFINKRGEFTVNIALVESNEPVLGVVFAPALSRLFYTKADGTAVEELGPLDPDDIGDVQRLRVRHSNNDALTAVASKSHRDAATDEYLAKYNISEFKAAGSSLKFCLIAAGEADLYPRLGRTMEWDTAAADAILRAAGGKTLNFTTKIPLDYGKQEYENSFFIAFGAGVQIS